MSYSCSDFTDDMLRILAHRGIIDGERIPDDDPEAQAELAAEGINDVADSARDLKAAVHALRSALAYVELFTADGVTRQPARRFIRANGDFDAEGIAAECHAALAKLPPVSKEAPA